MAENSPKWQNDGFHLRSKFHRSIFHRWSMIPMQKARCKEVSSLSIPRAGRQLEAQVQMFHDSCHSQRTPFLPGFILPKKPNAYVHAWMLNCFTHVWLCDPMDCSPPSSSAHRILQARILEWVAISFSKGSSQSRDQNCLSHLLHWQADSLPLASPGIPF